MKSINQETVMNEIIALAADECRTKNPTDMIETYIEYMKDESEQLRHTAEGYGDESYTEKAIACETRVAIAEGILAELTAEPEEEADTFIEDDDAYSMSYSIEYHGHRLTIREAEAKLGPIGWTIAISEAYKRGKAVVKEWGMQFPITITYPAAC